MSDSVVGKLPDAAYPGKIIGGPYSQRLQSYIAECIDALLRLDSIGNPAITYISAWHDAKKGMWYEYLSPRFTELFACDQHGFTERFRSSIIERRVYKKHKDKLRVETQTITNGDIHKSRSHLRNEGKAKGLVEAIYKVTLPGGHSGWLKDQAIVEAFETDGILLSSGCLTDVSKEMEAEAALKQTEAALQKANLQLQQLATLDGLTQIANRRRLDDWIDAQWRHLTRKKDPLSLIMCDIDYFKRYNDTYGHQAGDDCLKRIARTIAHAARRSSDLVARYGGEEFIVALPNTNINGAEMVARDVQDRVSRLKLVHADSPISDHVTLSMGIATMTPNADTVPAELIKQADQALYDAKKKGRNRIVLFAD
jgi:diguanylate cyclase (GGDEF)-like protein